MNVKQNSCKNRKTIPPYLTNCQIHNPAFTNGWKFSDLCKPGQWKCWFWFDLTHTRIRGNNTGGLLSWKHLRGPEIQGRSREREREREISLSVYSGEAAKPQWSHKQTTWDTHAHILGKIQIQGGQELVGQTREGWSSKEGNCKFRFQQNLEVAATIMAVQ